MASLLSYGYRTPWGLGSGEGQRPSGVISIWATHEGGMSKLLSSSSLPCEERRWMLARALEQRP